MRYAITDDPYSSQCFSIPIVTLKIKPATSSLNYLTIRKTLSEILRKPNLHYIICKHELRDVAVIHALEASGFKLMSVGATLRFSKKSSSINTNTDPLARIEPYDDAHRDLLNSLLEDTPRFFYGTHYYNSPYLDSKLTDRFYARWILTDVQGRCNKNFVAVQNDRIVGFIMCMEKPQTAKLDLIWVDQSVRRKGIGTSLIATLSNNIKPNTLVCDAYIAEKKALDLYLSTGFKIQNVYAIYHKYFDESTVSG